MNPSMEDVPGKQLNDTDWTPHASYENMLGPLHIFTLVNCWILTNLISFDQPHNLVRWEKL